VELVNGDIRQPLAARGDKDYTLALWVRRAAAAKAAGIWGIGDAGRRAQGRGEHRV